jgi:excisionase family DNA binding protein
MFAVRSYGRILKQTQMERIFLEIPLDELLNRFEKIIDSKVNTALGMGSQESLSNEPVTSKELAKFLKVTEQTISTYRKKGQIPFIEIGSAIRFNLNSVVKALEKN